MLSFEADSTPGLKTHILMPNVLYTEILNKKYSSILFCAKHKDEQTIFLIKNAGKTIQPKVVCCEEFSHIVQLQLTLDRSALGNQQTQN